MDAQRHHHRGKHRGPCPIGSGRRGSEQSAEARVAGRDHSGDRRRLRDRRDHAPDGQVQALRLALAGAVHDRGGGRSAARQDPAVARPAARSRGGGARGGADADRSAGGDHPLDRRDDGEGGRHQRQLGPAHLARPWAPAAPGPAVQALERSAVRREAARRGRALSRPAGARHRALGRREEPDPGARPHPARPADEEGPRSAP